MPGRVVSSDIIASMHHRRHTQRVLLFLLAAIIPASACSSDDEGCIWDVLELLERGGVRRSGDEVECGTWTNGDSRIGAALECLVGAPSERGASMLVSNCIDCYNLSYYYATPSSEIFHIHQTAHDFDAAPPRATTLERCSALVMDGRSIECVFAERLYVCGEPAEQAEVYR